jgi:hypothetical protein
MKSFCCSLILAALLAASLGPGLAAGDKAKDKERVLFEQKTGGSLGDGWS